MASSRLIRRRKHIHNMERAESYNKLPVDEPIQAERTPRRQALGRKRKRTVNCNLRVASAAAVFVVACALIAYRPWVDRKGGVYFNSLSVSTFLTLADPHLNVSYRGTQKYGVLGEDCNIELYNSTIQAAAQRLAQYDMFFFFGDNVVHSWEDDGHDGPLSDAQTLDIFDTSQDMLLSQLKEEHFRYGIVNSIFGNDDVAPDYAAGRTPEEVLAYMGELVDRMALRQPLTPSRVESLKRMSCTVVDAGDALGVVVLNTVVYSPLYAPAPVEEDPMDQFACLEAALGGLRREGKRVLLVGHIPPMLGSYDGAPQWRPEPLARYRDLVWRHRDVIAAQLFAHTHRNEYRVAPPAPSQEGASGSDAGDGGTSCAGCPPLLVFGGISPMFGNNPSFAEWDVNLATGEVLAIRTRYAPLEGESGEEAQEEPRDAFGGSRGDWAEGGSTETEEQVAAAYRERPEAGGDSGRREQGVGAMGVQREGLHWQPLLDTGRDLGLPALSGPHLWNLREAMLEELRSAAAAAAAEKAVVGAEEGAAPAAAAGGGGAPSLVSRYLRWVHSGAGVARDGAVRAWYVCAARWFAARAELEACVAEAAGGGALAAPGGGPGGLRDWWGGGRPIGDHMAERRAWAAAQQGD